MFWISCISKWAFLDQMSSVAQSESFSRCSQLQMLCVSVLAHHTRWKNVCCQTIISYFCLSSVSLLFQCCKRFLLFYIFLCLFVFPTVGARRPDKHGIGWKTKRGGSQHMTSPIIKHFFVSLFAVVHAAEYAPISRHRAQGPFIPKGATAEQCIMVICPFATSW